MQKEIDKVASTLKVSNRQFIINHGMYSGEFLDGFSAWIVIAVTSKVSSFCYFK